ncbi:phosphatidylinositol-glycan biosynthesis class F protein [Coccinella septempunctata]|uniref:phosphatidylinositol-glycan biosynthesis class F protein n=1 Tax=Coccinella septempunctata TaxID=41139 RepID=UPI001D096868|nr:phosphatidylinositol-glycan biosynthesis class F protein [Coccinella septempunctata]
MFALAPKDKYSPVVTKLNLFTVFYVPVLSIIISLTDNHFKLGKFENLSVVLVLGGLEYAKYYFFKSTLTDADTKSKRKKSSKLERTWKVLSFNVQMVCVIYVVAVLLGAQLLNKFQETLMLAVLITTLAIFPITLYTEVDDLFQLLGMITMMPSNSYSNLFISQLQTTLVGAWLGATVIPLDWNREWQVWPNSCIYGALAGFYVTNIYFYIIHSTKIVFRNKKNHKFENVL